MTRVSLAPLRPMAMNNPPELPGYPSSGTVLAGELPGGLFWIVTQDADGHTEASLSLAGGGRPTRQHVRQFFGIWGVKPIGENFRATKTRHWVVAKGKRQ